MENDVKQSEKLSSPLTKENNQNVSNHSFEEEQNKNQQKTVLVIVAAILVAIFLLFVIFKKDKNLDNILFDNDEIIKPLSEQREFRIVTLPNKIEAILISDPKASKSSASLSVGVGSFMDDSDAYGLAHFCEHMLFLGSKTYPDAGTFDDYISANSGHMNAFTESERTTYYFEVANKAFNKSLHIFSRMFAEPLFDMNYMNKEIDAVNSEAEKNLNSDGWRKRQLLKSISNLKHPYYKFSTGNTETLRGIPAKDLNIKLKSFYEKYYKSPNMKIAIVSNSTLDELQKQTFSIFSDIRGKDSKEAFTIYGNMETNEIAFKKKHLGKILYYKRISTGNILDIMFYTNSTKSYNDIKPLDYLDYMLKFSGEKSLINFLKKKNFANKLDSTIYETFKSFTIYHISVELTDNGLNEVDSVVKLVFNYLNKIKNTKKEKKIYDEIKKIYEIAFKFQEKNEDYTSFVSSLSTSMFDIDKKYQYQNLLYWDYLHSEFDGELVDRIIKEIKVENCIILIGSHSDITQNLNNQFFKNSQKAKEKWYGTDYIINNLDEFYMDNLSQYPVTLNSRTDAGVIADPVKSFELRGENKFISKLTNLVDSCNEKNIKCENDEYNEKNPNLTPTPLHDENNLRIFYKIDKTFKVPKVYLYIHILSDALKKSVFSYSNFHIFAEYLEYSLNTNLSEAVESGNNISLEFDDAGLTINIAAYSDVLEKIVEIILNDIFKLQPNEYTFKEIFDTSIKNFEDNKIKKPVMKNKLFFNKLLKFNNTIYTEVLDFYYDKNEVKNDNSISHSKKRIENSNKNEVNNKKKTNNENLNITLSKTHENNSSLHNKKTLLKENKKFKFTHKQLFEDFKKFYEDFKTKLVFNILFYGHMESTEEILSISKNIKNFVTGHSQSSRTNNMKSNLVKENNLISSSNNGNPMAPRKITMKKHSVSNDNIDLIRNSIHIHRRIDDQIIYQIQNDADNEINHGITTYYQIGPRDIQRSLNFMLIDKCIGTIFYYNLRTIQQLGYIIHASSQLIDSILYYKIIVQGSKKSPLEVEKAINDVFMLADEKLKKCQGEAFESAKDSIREILLKKDDNLKERSIRLWKEIYYNTYEFDRYSKLNENIDNIKFDDVYKLFKSAIFDNPNRISIHQYSSNFNKTQISSIKNTKISYDLNKNKQVIITDDIIYYKNQPFINAFKNKRFSLKNLNINANERISHVKSSSNDQIHKNNGGSGTISKSHLNLKKTDGKLKKKNRESRNMNN